MADDKFERNNWINDDDDEECSQDVNSHNINNIKSSDKEEQTSIRSDKMEDRPWMVKFNKAYLDQLIEQENYENYLLSCEELGKNETSMLSENFDSTVLKMEEDIEINDSKVYISDLECIDMDLALTDDELTEEMSDVSSISDYAAGIQDSSLQIVPTETNVSEKSVNRHKNATDTLSEGHHKSKENVRTNHAKNISDDVDKMVAQEFKISKITSVTNKENAPTASPTKYEKIKNKQKDGVYKRKYESYKRDVQEQCARRKREEESNRKKWKSTVSPAGNTFDTYNYNVDQRNKYFGEALTDTSATSEVIIKKLNNKVKEANFNTKNVKATSNVKRSMKHDQHEKKKKIDKSSKPRRSDHYSEQSFNIPGSHVKALVETKSQNRDNQCNSNSYASTTRMSSVSSIEKTAEGTNSSSSFKNIPEKKNRKKHKNKSDIPVKDKNVVQNSKVSKNVMKLTSDKPIQPSKKSKKRKSEDGEQSYLSVCSDKSNPDNKAQMEKNSGVKKRRYSDERNDGTSLDAMATIIEQKLKETSSHSEQEDNHGTGQGDQWAVQRTESQNKIKLTISRNNEENVAQKKAPNNSLHSDEQFSMVTALENCGLENFLKNSNSESSNNSLIENSDKSETHPSLVVNNSVNAVNEGVVERTCKRDNTDLTKSTLEGNKSLEGVPPNTIPSGLINENSSSNKSYPSGIKENNPHNAKSRIKYTPQNSLFIIQKQLTDMQNFNNLIDELELSKSKHSVFVKDLFKNWIKKNGFSLARDVQCFKNSCKNKDPLEELEKFVSIPKMEISLLLKLCDVSINDDIDVAEEKNIFILPPPILELLKDIPKLYPGLQSYVISMFEQSKCFLSPKAIKDLNSVISISNSKPSVSETLLNPQSHMDSNNNHPTSKSALLLDGQLPQVSSENSPKPPLKMNIDTQPISTNQHERSTGGNASLSQTFEPPSPTSAQMGGPQSSPRRSSQAQMESQPYCPPNIETTNTPITTVVSKASQTATGHSNSTSGDMPLLATPPLIASNEPQINVATTSMASATVPTFYSPIVISINSPQTPPVRNNWQKGLQDRRQLSPKKKISNKFTDVVARISQPQQALPDVLDNRLQSNLYNIPNKSSRLPTNSYVSQNSVTNSFNSANSTYNQQYFPFLKNPTVPTENTNFSGVPQQPIDTTFSSNKVNYAQSVRNPLSFEQQNQMMCSTENLNVQRQGQNESFNSDNTAFPNLNSAPAQDLPNIPVSEILAILGAEQTPNQQNYPARNNDFSTFSNYNGSTDNIQNNATTSSPISQVPSVPQICVRKDLSDLQRVNTQAQNNFNIPVTPQQISNMGSRSNNSIPAPGNDSQRAWHMPRPYTPSQFHL